MGIPIVRKQWGTKTLNQFYDSIKNKMLLGQFNWLSDDYKLYMLSATYVFDGADTTMSDVAGGAILGTSQLISGKTVTSNNMLASPASFLAIVDTEAVTQFVLATDTGNVATDLLVAYFDQGFGLPFIPSGGNYNIDWGVINGTVAEL